MEFQLGVNTSRVMHYTYELMFIKSYIHKSAHASEKNNVFCTSHHSVATLEAMIITITFHPNY